MLLKETKSKVIPEIEIKEISDDKILFKCSSSWANCLNACRGDSPLLFFLPNTFLNQKKLQKIIPDFPSSYLKEDCFFHPLLREYQEKDIEFLSGNKCGAIFNEVRTGKTPIALLTWDRWKIKNLLIIAPVTVQRHWQNSVAEWLNKPAYVITFLEKNVRSSFYRKLQIENGWILIISKDTFKLDEQEIKKIKREKEEPFQDCCIIIDEAHFLHNYDSKQSKSVYNLNSVTYKLVLTGTPIVNNYSDIFGILKFLFPEEYCNFEDFVEKYFWTTKLWIKKRKKFFLVKKATSIKEHKKQELFHKINSFSVNRKKEEVLHWLPEVVRQQEYLIMDEEQWKIYKKVEKRVEILKTKSIKEVDPDALLKTAVLFPESLKYKKNGIKTEYIINYLKEQIDHETGKSILIFSTRSSTFLVPLAKKLKKEKIKTQIIIGETPIIDREKIIQSFQKKINKILLCNTQTLNLGVELSQADVIIFADRSYSLADNEQAEARFLPPTDKGNAKTKLIIDLICKETIDEKIISLLERKKKAKQ